jgi:hypothetical protein
MTLDEAAREAERRELCATLALVDAWAAEAKAKIFRGEVDPTLYNMLTEKAPIGSPSKGPKWRLVYEDPT